MSKKYIHIEEVHHLFALPCSRETFMKNFQANVIALVSHARLMNKRRIGRVHTEEAPHHPQFGYMHVTSKDTVNVLIILILFEIDTKNDAGWKHGDIYGKDPGSGVLRSRFTRCYGRIIYEPKEVLDEPKREPVPDIAVEG